MKTTLEPVCKHGHITPPECLACVAEERDQLQQENRTLRKMADAHIALRENLGLKEGEGVITHIINPLQAETTRLRDELCKSRDCYNKVWEEKTRLREALQRYAKGVQDYGRIAQQALAPQGTETH